MSKKSLIKVLIAFFVGWFIASGIASNADAKVANYR